MIVVGKMSDIKKTLEQRAKAHGNFADHARVAVGLKQKFWAELVAVKGGADMIKPEMQEGVDMILHKLARVVSGDHTEPDHWHDIAGYATLVERVCLIEKGSQHPSDDFVRATDGEIKKFKRHVAEMMRGTRD